MKITINKTVPPKALTYKEAWGKVFVQVLTGGLPGDVFTVIQSTSCDYYWVNLTTNTFSAMNQSFDARIPSNWCEVNAELNVEVIK